MAHDQPATAEWPDGAPRASYRPRQAPMARNMTRRERIALRRGSSTAHPGGIAKGCGCRYTRTGAEWLHITPCTIHRLAVHPLPDEAMKQIGAAA